MAPRCRSLRSWIASPVCVGRGSGMVTVDPFTRRVLRRRQPETAVTLAQPPQDRHGKQHHPGLANDLRSEEHTSELQSLMRISYAVFCSKPNNTNTLPLTLIHHHSLNNTTSKPN